MNVCQGLVGWIGTISANVEGDEIGEIEIVRPYDVYVAPSIMSTNSWCNYGRVRTFVKIWATRLLFRLSALNLGNPLFFIIRDMVPKVFQCY